MQRGAKPLKSRDDWLQHTKTTPATWADEAAKAIELFVAVVTATHGYGTQATEPADAATNDDDDEKDKSLLIGTTHNQEVTYAMNWSWFEPWVVPFAGLATTIRNSTVRANEHKVVVTADMIMGSTDKTLRALVDAFVAAIANGQRYGTPAEYEQITKQHYTGEGCGLHSSIMCSKAASNPLMHGIMQDMFRSAFAGPTPDLSRGSRAKRDAGIGEMRVTVDLLW